MDYSDEGMERAIALDRVLSNFRASVQSVLRTPASEGDATPAGEEASALAGAIDAYEAKVDALFRDDFDYPSVLLVLMDLAKTGNAYLTATAPGQADKAMLTQAVAHFDRTMDVLGLSAAQEADKYTLEPAKISSAATAFHADIAAALEASPIEGYTLPALEMTEDTPVHDMVDAVVSVRQAVREAALAATPKAKAVLAVCDAVRNHVLPELGIRIEDSGKEAGTWKEANPHVWAREQRRQREFEAAKKAAKAEAALRKAEREAAKCVPPQQMFRADPKWTQFNEDGIPTHQVKKVEGEPDTEEVVPKSAAKKLLKQWKLREKQLAKLQAKLNANK
ncbi:cysteinyl-tRNA synthetase/mycothiol ligase [Kipferlia bialata]|uniref:Cysteinyl-tRNA synthetase/mycothiol ligase n=1 Tax=Kipferlia bialata TaxID=797122 RepID=A0A9K3CU43_9EUKA|nr:cysteinyl-tRNA synthetase/mycothiol ligase [Kipferlia bialata]|eukprot:g4664.t1